MYPYSHLPAPLSAAGFYILLSLAHGELHGYALIGACANNSLGSIKLSGGTLYPLLQKLHDEGFVDITGKKPAGKSSKPRLHYALSPSGAIRLQEELQRLDHAVKIGQRAGLMRENQLPADIQHALLELKIRA